MMENNARRRRTPRGELPVSVIVGVLIALAIGFIAFMLAGVFQEGTSIGDALAMMDKIIQASPC